MIHNLWLVTGWWGAGLQGFEEEKNPAANSGGKGQKINRQSEAISIASRQKLCVFDNALARRVASDWQKMVKKLSCRLIRLDPEKILQINPRNTKAKYLFAFSPASLASFVQPNGEVEHFQWASLRECVTVRKMCHRGIQRAQGGVKHCLAGAKRAQPRRP